MFDAGKWAMVPEEPVRGEILRRLIEVKNEGKIEGLSNQISAWPHFTKVHSLIGVVMCKISLARRFFSSLMASIDFVLSTSVYKWTLSSTMTLRRRTLWISIASIPT
jgi:hypothetical protein